MVRRQAAAISSCTVRMMFGERLARTARTMSSIGASGRSDEDHVDRAEAEVERRQHAGAGEQVGGDGGAGSREDVVGVARYWSLPVRRQRRTRLAAIRELALGVASSVAERGRTIRASASSAERK